MRTMMAAVLLAVSACSGGPSNTQVLSNRITARLTQVEPCNRPVSIEYLKNGVRVHFQETALFVDGQATLTACGQYAVASVTQAMLDPAIMQVMVEPGDPSSALSLQRSEAVRKMLSNVGLRQPPVLIGITPSSGGLGILLTT